MALDAMPDPRDEIARLEAEIARLRSASKPAPDSDSGFFARLEPEPEPGPSMYGTSRHPDEVHERVLAAGHAVGGHAGLAAGVSN